MLLSDKIELATACIVVFLMNANAAQVDCSPQGFTARLKQCYTFEPAMTAGSADQIISNMCNSTECSIKCYSDAVRPCASVGIGRLTDTTAQKVATRYACANKADMLQALTNCIFYATTYNCMMELMEKLSNVTYNLISTHPNVEAYIQGFCNAVKNFQICTPVMPFASNNTCSTDQLMFLHNLYKITYSLTSCGIKQDNPMFSLYDGPVMCNNPPTIG